MTYREMEAKIAELELALIYMTDERDKARETYEATLVAMAESHAQLYAENTRLRAALEPTAETMARIRAALRYKANWSDPLIEAILAAARDVEPPSQKT